MPAEKVIMAVKNVSKIYKLGKRQFHALRDINLSINAGDTLGIVGESGSGKSTLGKVMLQLEMASGGAVLFRNTDIATLPKNAMQKLRCQMQMIFQDPYASLNPRMTIEQIIGEGIDIHNLATGTARRQIIDGLVDEVGLEKSMLKRYPHEFSGGQRQRIGIARALAVDPQLVVCDEPLSALDMRTQHRIMELLLRLKAAKKLTYVFISHDMHAVRAIADNVAVMHGGSVVEYGPAKEVFANPQHSYTQALLAAGKFS